jgi:hypothetical protein
MAGTETRQRSVLKPVRWTMDEFNTAAAKAEAAGLSFGAYIRASATGDTGPRAQRRTSTDAKLLRQVLGQLGRVGNNLNQIAHSLNAGENPHTQIPELAEALRAYMGMRDAIFEALGKQPSGPSSVHPQQV